MRTTLQHERIGLEWHDSEETLKGSIGPLPLRAGDEVEVILDVGSYQGKPFHGPLTVTVREDGAQYGTTRTVPPGDRTWHTTLPLPEEGIASLDVSFRSTRLKVLHANIEVGAARLPRAIWWSLVAAGAVFALLFGLNSLRTQRARKSQGATVVPESAGAVAAVTPAAPVAASPGTEAVISAAPGTSAPPADPAPAPGSVPVAAPEAGLPPVPPGTPQA